MAERLADASPRREERPMDNFAYALVATGLFKIALILSGTGSVYMGYRLFCHGIHAGIGSEVDTSTKGYTLTLKSIAPGTFFALFGSVLVGITAYRGMEVHFPDGSVTDSSYQATSKADPPPGRSGMPLRSDPLNGGTITAY
jgi:hypothetical protein